MLKLARKVVTLAPIAYGLLQSPKVRGLLMRGLRGASQRFARLEEQHADPTRGTLTGKPLGEVANPRVAKVEAQASKLPAGTFQRASQAAAQAEEKLASYDKSRTPAREQDATLPTL